MEIQEVKEGNAQHPADAAPATEQKAQATVEPTQVAEQQAQPTEQIDYQALYEQEKERLAKAEFTLYKKSKEERAKRQQKEIEQPQISTIIDHEEIKNAVEEQALALFEAQRKKDAEDIIEEELFNLSSNEDERRLIRLKYENAIQKTGYSRLAIRSDLDDARVLANKVKYQREKTELAQAAVSKQTTSNTSVGASVEKPTANDDLSKHFSAYDWQWMQKRKWTEAQIRQAMANKSI